MGFFDKLFGKSKGSKEIQACESALEARPHDTIILKKLGDLYLKANDFTNASLVYVRLGDTYSGKGFYPKAIALYKQAIKINSQWERPYEKLADLYKIQGFNREAAAQYVKLSEVLEANGQGVEATQYMQKAAELDPIINETSRTVHAFKVAEKGMHDPLPKSAAPKTEMDQTDFYDLNKELDKEIKELSIDESLDQTEDTTGVESVFRAIEESAQQEGKEDPLFLYNMGLAYRETGLLDDAIESFLKVINTGDKLYDAYVMLGVTYREKGMYPDSLEALKAAVSLEDASANMKIGILYEIAQTYKALGDNQNALNIFREIQKEQKEFRDVELEIIRLAGGG